MTAVATVATAAGAAADSANHAESAWSKLDAATKFCGLSMNHQQRLKPSCGMNRWTKL